jgi:hypothetical protein
MQRDWNVQHEGHVRRFRRVARPGPLLALSRHQLLGCKCPLLGVKRTWKFGVHGTIALDQCAVQSLWLSMFMSGRSRFGAALAERCSSACCDPGRLRSFFCFLCPIPAITAPSQLRAPSGALIVPIERGSAGRRRREAPLPTVDVGKPAHSVTHQHRDFRVRQHLVCNTAEHNCG